ncbi:MAG: TetR/AcrR family transcriptional regulator [Acholeplasmatales bacterium]|nr:TetR/AcrR family transcriptional regulator [Acholeplasmatales bacterium]
MSKMRDAQKNFIIEEALKLFLSKSIEDVTMSEIAKTVEIGDATLYRYFTKKQNIIVLSAISLSKKVFDAYFNFDGLEPVEVIRKFYTNYLTIFKEHREFFRFVNEFDAFIINEDYDSSNYETGVDLYKERFLYAYSKAVKEGKVRELSNVGSYYNATTHVLLDLGKRLSRNRKIVSADDNNYDELKIMVDIILNSLIK